MNPQVEKFFADAEMHVIKMIKRKHKNSQGHLTDGQIMEGAEALYHRIQGGEIVKPINYASRVYALAKDLQGKQHDEDFALIMETKEKIEMMETEHLHAMEEIKALRRRDNKLWAIAAAVASVAFAIWRTWHLW